MVVVDNMDRNILEGKRILIVNDEPRILDTVEEAFASSQVMTVRSLDEARLLIAQETFDLVILDTVGVNGCALLETCYANKLPAAMLTARVVAVKAVNQAIKRGAILFFPKDDLHRLPETVADLLDRLEKGKTYSTKLLRRLGAAFRELRRVVREEIDQPPKYPPTYY